MIPAPVKLVFILALLAGVAFTGWTANGWRLGRELQSLKTEHEKTVADAALQANARLVQLTKAHDADAERRAAIDREQTAKLTKAKNENKILADRIASGSVGLRIAATCPAATPGGAEARQSAGVDTGAGATLDSSAGRAYSALREGIINTEAKLTACQQILRE